MRSKRAQCFLIFPNPTSATVPPGSVCAGNKLLVALPELVSLELLRSPKMLLFRPVWTRRWLNNMLRISINIILVSVWLVGLTLVWLWVLLGTYCCLWPEQNGWYPQIRKDLGICMFRSALGWIWKLQGIRVLSAKHIIYFIAGVWNGQVQWFLWLCHFRQSCAFLVLPSPFSYRP